MKKLLIILLSAFSLAAVAQNKKTVAVLDPICRDNSVNAFFRQMVRGIMESAVTASNEYEAYDRSAFDQIQKEQAFQRTGAVSDSQIKKMGEMAGVDYVLVTEVSAYENYMNVIIKVLNVITGQSTKSQSELMEMNPPSVQKNCRGLATQIFSIVDTNRERYGELLLEEGKYVGEILNGKPHGKGKLMYKDSNVNYDGGWENGIRQGYGIIEGNGEKYEGNFKNNVYSGHGIYYFSDGGRYEGNWEDGVMSGQGIYYFADGNKYVGNFENGWINGYGTGYYADGCKHVGYYKDGNRHGAGITYFEGGRFEGNFREEKAEGMGVFYYSVDNSVEKGNFVNGQRDGEWIQIDSNGNKKTATYKDGNIIGDWH